MKGFVALLVLLVACVYSAEAATVSQAEFNAAVTKNGYKAPSTEVYRNFVEGASKYSKEEQAMFLAQLLHESAGFRYTEELKCLTGNKCAGKYVDKVGLSGKKYYGRGYMQLTWGANYKAASQALGLGDKLLREPELVATNKKYAMLVSVWFWDARVRPVLGSSNQFGRTTKAINGGECKYPKYHSRAQNRWKIYLKVAEAFSIKNKAEESGCYN
uniref:Putative endochitinase 3 n=1 Tax=Melittobia sp. EOM-2016 TaxID=1775962 RepID=A0A0U3IQM7_9HYME|nr:putative endochitinase 3 [Melittobia sp. EOM-2016]